MLLCYLKGKIYTVRCRYDDNLIYVGSTIGRLTDSFSHHKNRKTTSLYKYIETNDLKYKVQANWSRNPSNII